MPWGCLQLREEKNYNSVGDITDKYEIGELLSAKEFCELCLARERRTDRLVVCKRFRKKDGRKVRQAARNEILILKMVSHPNILQLIDTFETRREFYIIQELATGGDVFDWILDLGCYTERDASSLIRQVLEALAYLHSLRIVHRNLKLENLVYHTQQSHAKVVLRDFYLSRFENGAITEPCGTPEYLAPEVIARQHYGRPVDCWAVGVILFILQEAGVAAAGRGSGPEDHGTGGPGTHLDRGQCGFGKEPQGGGLCPDREELCQSQMAEGHSSHHLHAAAPCPGAWRPPPHVAPRGDGGGAPPHRTPHHGATE
ncbi:caM kinase-like vesicle-associated protein isoform X2 [Dermochelys coriacea]|uniref:caM kinase-like vesicle-associated protein isoform X2 n=1 Tax=Dermochelys coriacea TaxID=27794 RepID=UPI0018E73560|nr:caM kinase-like vesicle-associated protein isoform X2 [Dermochelys coriacea]